MGKHGPCHHCGVTSTPLWRNGPPEKPILCNACGSRWRTKGSLANYTPLHSRELIETQEVKITKVKSITFKPKDQKFPKKKQWNNFVDCGHELQPDQNSRKILEEDSSNRSSSGSAVSYSESCAYFGTMDTYDYAGSTQSNVWDSLVPSRKRTGVTRPNPSSVEKLTKDLYSILHEQQSSYLSGASEDDLLYESETPWGSIEMGYGSVLIRHPNINKKPTEEESEASSLPMNSKSYIVKETCSGSESIFAHSEIKETSSVSPCAEKYKSSIQTAQQHIKRDKSSNEKFKILCDRESLLCSTDLTGIVNLDVFMKYFTDEEQQQLMKLLPSIDTAKHPDSLGGMFTSFQFVKTTSYFQQLLCDGIFNLSHPEPKSQEYQSLRKLILGNLTNSMWIEHYRKLKDVKVRQNGQGRGTVTGSNCLGASPLAILKRPRGHQSFPDVKGTLRNPKRISKSSDTDRTSNKAHVLHSSNYVTESNRTSDEFMDKEESSFSPRNLFAVPLQFLDDSSEQDLLLEAPCNAPTPEAELLYHPWKQNAAPSSSIVNSEVADGEESRSNCPSATGLPARCY